MPRSARLVAAVLAAGFVTVGFGWPLATILARGLRAGALADVVTDPGLRSVAWFTLWQAAVSTMLTLVIGMVPAYAVARFRFPGRRALLAFVTVPFVLPTVVVGAAFLALLPERWHQTVGAVLVAHVFFNLAVVVRTVGGFWGGLDRGLDEAARTLGASPWQVARHVTFPLLRPAMIAAASIVFLFTFSSYGVVTVLGGPRHPTIEVELYRRAVLLGDLPVAAALSLIQLLAMGALLAWWSRAQAAGARALALRPDAGRRPVGRQRWVVGAIALGTVAALALPMVRLVVQSFEGGGGRWSLAGWRAVGADGWAALAASARFALAAGLLAVVIGSAAAFAIAGGGRLGRVLDTGLMLPLGTSAVTLGFGLLITFDQAPLDLRGTPVMIPLAHALVGIPFVVRALLPALRAVDPHLREAAATLGAPPLRAWAEIDVRLAARPILAGAGFAVAVSLGEFGATSFLTRRGQATLPTEIATALARPGELSLARAGALATILLVATAGLVLLVDRLRPDHGAW